ncbi:aspartate aminotransferase family protein [Pseudovibrio exalbescens]|uniref:aspartate aminotransferase family protein n=1 Tax=Pseudovibrio exalbescens TaxID=197461 RepID=UPI002365D4C9|nr:aspartate aminotransferase family protein [Pseudovibrio exalbescens]MDD7908730.1 aspartate aminotransferase family protein [Pseudovibrio exalbescens]
MSHIFPRHTAMQLPRAVKGDGCYIIDQNGKRYLDASGGAAVSCLGHSNEAVRDAIKAQVDRIAFAHTGFFTSEPAEELADLLASKAPENLDRVYLVSGGSEATEAAIKLARQYHVEKGDVRRSRIIARLQSYHGNTLGSLAAGGNMWRREPFEPLLVDMSHIDPCYAYRHKRDDESIEDYGMRAANALEEEILRVGPETVAAFIAEPVVGATMGAVPPVPGYLRRIREICDTYGVLLILDEVMCGMGRTGYLFACEADKVTPDILCMAKGLGAGYQPIGAMMCSSEIYSAIENGSGFFQHGHTYVGHPTAAAAALAVFKQLSAAETMPAVNIASQKLFAALRARFGDHPHIGDIRGRGLFIGLELVWNRETKEPFVPALKLNARVKKHAFANGLVCYPMGGTIDGKHGDHILLAPPFIIEDQQIEEIMDRLDVALKVSLEEAGMP